MDPACEVAMSAIHEELVAIGKRAATIAAVNGWVLTPRMVRRAIMTAIQKEAPDALVAECMIHMADALTLPRG